MKNYPPSVIKLRADIKALDKAYDEIVKKLLNTQLVKSDYDLVEGELREAVWTFKDSVDTL